MPDVPYKYLKDENWETFYPITGASSVNGQIPVANGGTGADTAAGARANLGAVSAQDVTLASQPNDFVVSVSEGGTGAQTAAQARANLGVDSATIGATTELYSFTGTTSTSVSLSESADNFALLIFAIYSSYGSIMNTAIATPSMMASKTTQIYGDSSSQWGSVNLDSGYASATFNRTSSTTSKVVLYGLMRK